MSVSAVPTVRELVAFAVAQSLPRLEAEVLLAHALGWTRARLHAWPEHPPEPPITERYRQAVERRAAGLPIAYLTGRRDFWSLELTVSPATLIPRPDTELLVELALERIPADATWAIADLGTGSGAIALALAVERPRCRITATELSPQALAVATANARRLRLQNVQLVNGDWWQPLAEQRFRVVVCNPPYIASDDPHLQRGDLRHEPRQALESGPDGLDDLRVIVNGCRGHLEPGGWLLLEHGYTQGEAVRGLLQGADLAAIETRCDLAGLARVTLGQAPA